jgi:ParB-like chromosome segregation protein Spo0J
VSANHAMLKELKIDSIKVGQRHRRDMGDLTTLADSIRQEGLLQPIGVTDRLELVYGERRIRAVRDILKRKTILARVVDQPLQIGVLATLAAVAVSLGLRAEGGL